VNRFNGFRLLSPGEAVETAAYITSHADTGLKPR